MGEVSLWKDYMIYATLFGIADQVIKDMKKINPEYFNMDQLAAQMANESTLPTIYSTLHSSTSRAVANKAARESARQARASGRGGRSSWWREIRYFLPKYAGFSKIMLKMSRDNAKMQVLRLFFYQIALSLQSN